MLALSRVVWVRYDELEANYITLLAPPLGAVFVLSSGCVANVVVEMVFFFFFYSILFTCARQQ